MRIFESFKHSKIVVELLLSFVGAHSRRAEAGHVRLTHLEQCLISFDNLQKKLLSLPGHFLTQRRKLKIQHAVTCF